MILYQTGAKTVESKVEQFKRIGLTSSMYSKISEIVGSAVSNAKLKIEEENFQFRNFHKTHDYNIPFSTYGAIPCAVTYNINTGDIHHYNIGSINNEAIEVLDIQHPKPPYIMKNSYNISFNGGVPKAKILKSLNDEW